MPRPVSRSLVRLASVPSGRIRDVCAVSPRMDSRFSVVSRPRWSSAGSTRSSSGLRRRHGRPPVRGRRTWVRVSAFLAVLGPAVRGLVGRRSRGSRDVFDRRRPFRSSSCGSLSSLSRRWSVFHELAARLGLATGSGLVSLVRINHRRRPGVHRRHGEPRHDGPVRGWAPPRASGGLSLPVRAERRSARRVVVLRAASTVSSASSCSSTPPLSPTAAGAL